MSKTVTRPNSTLVPRFCKLTSNGIPNPGMVLNQSIRYSWVDSVTYGDNSPKWRDSIRNGYDATTTLSATRKRYRYTPGRLSLTTVNPVGDSYVITGVLGASTQPFGPDPSNLSVTSAVNKAKSMFSSKAIQVNTLFQGGIFLGELREALHGIRHPASALRKSVGLYLSRAQRLRSKILSVSSAARRQTNLRLASSAVAGLWLESQFHWRPLISDIDSGMKTLADRYEKHPLLKKIRAVGSSETTSSFTGPSSSAAGVPVTLSLEVLDTLRATAIYRGAIRVTRNGSSVVDRNLWGFNTQEFVPTAWELLPYSWLIDYFTNIGDIINSWRLLSSSVAWANRTHIRTSIRKYHCVDLDPPYVPSSGWRLGLFSSSSLGEWTTIDRAGFVDDFSPTFQLEIPGLSTKWLNLGALLVARSSDRRIARR